MLQSHLEAEHFERKDLFIANRYDLDDPEEEYPSDYIRNETGTPTTSVYITEENAPS